MSTETPETPVAATPPTVDLVAELLTEADNELHDGYDWKLHMGASGNVVQIGIEPFADDGTRLPEVHFRAIVVPGETVPDLAEVDRLTVRLQTAEAVMRRALAEVEHEEVVYLLNRYFTAAEAAQAEQGGAQ